MRFYDPGYWPARLVFGRLLGVVYLVAFISTLNQFRALCGADGLLPAPSHLRRAGVRRAPSIFHLRYSDRLATAAAGGGVVLSAAVVVGLVDRLPLWAAIGAWAALWGLYLSFVHAGQMFYGFVWEMLLLEAGFLGIFLGNATVAPPVLVVFLVRWVLVRLEVGAGLIKLRHDPAWRDLTALYYHHETQPLPNRLSWWFHHLPQPVHKLEVAANHVAQLVLPLGLLCPQPIASAAALAIVVTQLWLMASGNFAWLNLLTIALATTALDGRLLRAVLPLHQPVRQAAPGWFSVIVLAVAAVMVVLSIRPVRNMASRHQVMNAAYNPFYLGNTYGLFGRITRVRPEVVLEGTDDDPPGPDSVWKEYEFKAKPGSAGRRPRQVAPYHLRLDWLMWFAALSWLYAEAWFVPLAVKLLENDRATLRLLATNPFRDRPPRFLRATMYTYRFTTRQERRRTGQWWVRQRVGEYLPPIGLRALSER